MSELCIANNCRSRIANIARRIFQALKMISSGDSSFFEIDTMTTDSVFYYEMFGVSYVYITDMKYNSVPENSITDKPWAKDMDDVAKLLSKALARDCEFEMTEESKKSSLALYS